jgi:hypothetical protein
MKLRNFRKASLKRMDSEEPSDPAMSQQKKLRRIAKPVKKRLLKMVRKTKLMIKPKNYF